MVTGVCVCVWFFSKVIQWCTHHKDDPPPPEDDENKEKRTDDIPVWDQEFLKVDQGTLFELILVSVVVQLQLCKGRRGFDLVSCFVVVVSFWS